MTSAEGPTSPLHLRPKASRLHLRPNISPLHLRPKTDITPTPETENHITPTPETGNPYTRDRNPKTERKKKRKRKMKNENEIRNPKTKLEIRKRKPKSETRSAGRCGARRRRSRRARCGQIGFCNRLGLYHKWMDSGDCQDKLRARKRRFDPSLRFGAREVGSKCLFQWPWSVSPVGGFQRASGQIKGPKRAI